MCKCHSLDADKVDRSQTAQLKVDSLTAAVVKLEMVVQARWWSCGETAVQVEACLEAACR